MKTVGLTEKQKEVMNKLYHRGKLLELEKLAFDREFKTASDLILDAHGLLDSAKAQFDPNTLSLLVED